MLRLKSLHRQLSTNSNYYFQKNFIKTSYQINKAIINKSNSILPITTTTLFNLFEKKTKTDDDIFELINEIEKIGKSKDVLIGFMGFIEGNLKIGLNNNEIKQLFKNPNVIKSNQIPYAITKKISGAMSISSGIIFAKKLGLNTIYHHQSNLLLEIEKEEAILTLGKTPISLIYGGNGKFLKENYDVSIYNIDISLPEEETKSVDLSVGMIRSGIEELKLDTGILFNLYNLSKPNNDNDDILKEISWACDVTNKLHEFKNPISNIIIPSNIIPSNIIPSNIIPSNIIPSKEETKREINTIIIDSIGLETKIDNNKTTTISTNIKSNEVYDIYQTSIKHNNNNTVEFLTVVGEDLAGKIIKLELSSPSVEVLTSKDVITDQTINISSSSSSNDLILRNKSNNNNNNIGENLLLEHIAKIKPKYILTGNSFVETLSLKQSDYNYKLCLTSLEPNQISNRKHHLLNIKDIETLEKIYQQFNYYDKFELDWWFPQIDKYGLEFFKLKLEKLIIKFPELRNFILEKGIIIQSTSLIPWFDHIFLHIENNDDKNSLLHFWFNDTKKNSKKSKEALCRVGIEGIVIEYYSVKIQNNKNEFISKIISELDKDFDILKSEKRGEIIMNAMN